LSSGFIKRVEMRREHSKIAFVTLVFSKKDGRWDTQHLRASFWIILGFTAECVRIWDVYPSVASLWELGNKAQYRRVW
jgi:hypothetical protein